MLNGEDVKDEAAIRLVDPLGNSSDMELFYACKRIGEVGDLSDAIETIDDLRKKNDKLRERLKKKHFELEKCLESKNSGGMSYRIKINTDDFNKDMNTILESIKGVVETCNNSSEDKQVKDVMNKVFDSFVGDLPKAIAQVIANKVVSVLKERGPKNVDFKQYFINPLDTIRIRDILVPPISFNPDFLHRPKFQIGDKVFYIRNGVVTQSSVKNICNPNSYKFCRYFLADGHLDSEDSLFGSVEDLLKNIKENIHNGE